MVFTSTSNEEFLLFGGGRAGFFIGWLLLICGFLCPRADESAHSTLVLSLPIAIQCWDCGLSSLIGLQLSCSYVVFCAEAVQSALTSSGGIALQIGLYLVCL